MTPKEKHFETAVQRVASTRNGDAIGPNLFWDIAIALDADSQKRHEETIELLDSHISEDRERHHNMIRQFNIDRESQANDCARRHMELFEEQELPKLIRQPRRSDDPPNISYGLFGDEEVGDIRRAWRVGKWFLLAGGLVLLDIFGRYLSNNLLGYPS